MPHMDLLEGKLIFVLLYSCEVLTASTVGWFAILSTSEAESEEELRSFLKRVQEESERAGLKLNIKKFKIMASGPITPWQIEGEKVEVVTDFLFLALKSLQMVTAAMKSEDVCLLEGKLRQT